MMQYSFDHVNDTFSLHNSVIQIRWLKHDSRCRTIVENNEAIMLDLFKNTNEGSWPIINDHLYKMIWAGWR